MNAIAKFRESNGLTQEQVAKILGTTKATVSRWETEARRPDPAMAVAIEGKLGIPRQALRPDLFSIRSDLGEIQPHRDVPRGNADGKSNWEVAYGSLKGQIKARSNFKSAYSAREWAEIDREWSRNWDKLLKR